MLLVVGSFISPTDGTVKYSTLIGKRIQLNFRYGLILLILVCCEMFLPLKGWTQSFSDTGSFSFTGGHNPVNPAIVFPEFRQFLPGDGLKVGPVRLHPFLGVAEVFTDNVFKTNTRRRSDFLTTIAPGIQASLPFGGRHSMLFDYRAAQFLYGKFSENNALTQDGVGQMSLDFPRGLKVDFKADHVEGFDARGSEVDSRQQDITKWNANSFRTQAEIIGANLGIRVGLNYTELHFKNNNQAAPRDRKGTGGDLTVFVPANATTSALIGIGLSNITYDKNKHLDNFSYGAFTGFRLAPSRQLSGELNVGYTILNFDRHPEGRVAQAMELTQKGLSPGGKQQKILFMRGDLRWRPTSRLDIRLRPFRSIFQSAVFNTSTFTQTGVSLSARQSFRKRFSVRGSFLFSNNRFEEGRRDNRFRWRTELDYRAVEWLGFRLGYLFEKRSSTQDVFDFYSNTIMVSVQGLL